ncbi:hypothetical protein Scep_025241 [Stephania cephalantha]|uniref:Cytochrome P450 n=1 Tax=Stephania cephalantha TaxID=152367 RepID=A0AAP0EL86_9MAGN
MELLLLFSSIVTLFILLLAIYKLPLLFSPKKHLPPSPPGALPIIGHLRLFFTSTPLHLTLQSISTKYSNKCTNYIFLKLGVRNVLVLSSPAAVQECIYKNDVAFANRPRSIANDYTSYDYTNVAFSNYGPLWRDHRRITTTNFFSSTSLHESSGVRHDAVRCLLRDLYNTTTTTTAPTTTTTTTTCTMNNGGEVDLKMKFLELTFNTMMSMSTGEAVGEGLHNTSEENKCFFELLVKDNQPTSLFMIPGDYLPWLRYFDVLKIERSVAEVSRMSDEYFEKIVERFRKEYYAEKKSKSVLDVLFSLQRENPEQYNDQIIKGMILTMFGAGLDTSAITLEWAMSLLLNHPEKLKKAVHEVDDNIEPHCLLKDSDISNLPYLKSIIQETLRLYPPAPLLIPHEAAHECKVEQYDIPSGTIVAMNAWAIHRDPKAWPEPDKFMPERFMRRDDNNKSKDIMFKFIPFGIGRRGCLGEGLAMHIMTLALGSLLRCFEWDKIGGDDIDMSEEVHFFLVKAKALKALCKPRLEMLNVLRQV